MIAEEPAPQILYEDQIKYWKIRCAEREKEIKKLEQDIQEIYIEKLGLEASNRTLESRIKMLERH